MVRVMSSLWVGLFILDSMHTVKDREKENRPGLTGLAMKEIG
jgi:hypothetical protein